MSFSRGNDLALAIRLADAADSITLARYQSIDLVVTTKPDNTPVTDADKATEEALRALLKNHRPDDGIVGEEFGNDAGSAERYWVIDPIDGTKNFLRGVPTWATLIGLIEKQSDGREVVVVGVVSAPALFRRWHASEGHGAFVSVNKAAPQRISVSQVSEVKDASISYSDFIGWGERLAPFQELMSSAWRTRGIGDFWSHMLVAEGAVDVAIEPSLALWDMAALDIIVREAGGRFTNVAGVDGSLGGSGLSTNSAIHQKIVDKLNGN
ncbi:inositol monophosphatase family protein [Candidatus Planktophila lacus]|jgi:histidinol-phosphatase|uniref:Histidinol-phosphatase n=2 Tax=Candidatus Planktophila TaxID=622681 RepID=A0AAC9YQB6_9ACTN|nr:inositol monophosphatase family protein [Candidatus Planktophila lacus]ASY10170.1 histidinol-phosphatase [Candidatus Planktophila lacus]ASY28592.1 histidinol-phosphatase [Candidatus Planktophila lacus]